MLNMGMSKVARIERAKRSLRALSIGDAFGEQFFFTRDGYVMSDERVFQLAAAHELPPPLRRYTDDTIMAMSIVDALREDESLNQDRLAALFGDRYALDTHRGYGATAHDILRSLAGGADWRHAAGGAFGGAGSMGNGGAMRAGPVGAYFADDLPAAVDAARRSAEVTHAHPEGQSGAIAVAVAAATVANGVTSPEELFEAVLDNTPRGEVWAGVEKATRLALQFEVRTAVSALGNGRRVTAPDTVPFALWCVARHLGDFEGALWTTVSGLGDRDTTCAIVASVIALGPGVEIPEPWESGTEPLSAMAL